MSIEKMPIPTSASIQKIQVREKPNPRWSSHFNNKLLTVAKHPIFGPNDTVFTVGSCFAERIRIALTDEAVNVGPPMEKIKLDKERFQIDSLPKRAHMNYYNSFTIRQEFERHIGEWTRDNDDYWTIKDKIWGGDFVYQDPYRRMVLGRTPEDLTRANELIDDAIDQGIKSSSVFFMTLGMAEVFVNEKSGFIACQKPGYAGGAGENETNFHMSDYHENLTNMQRIVDIITQLNPEARIVTTVSPVALARTFGDNDILTANMEGKSILRAALGQLARDNHNVTYFPSYELVMCNSPVSFRDDDGRHVDDWIVSKIVETFKEAHYDENFGQVMAAE